MNQMASAIIGFGTIIKQDVRTAKSVVRWRNARSVFRRVTWALVASGMWAGGSPNYTTGVNLYDESGVLRDSVAIIRASYGNAQMLIGPWNDPPATNAPRDVWNVPPGWTIEITFASASGSDDSCTISGYIITDDVCDLRVHRFVASAIDMASAGAGYTLAAANRDRFVLPVCYFQNLVAGAASLGFYVDILDGVKDYLSIGGVNYSWTKSPTSLTRAGLSTHNIVTLRPFLIPRGAELSLTPLSSNALDTAVDMDIRFVELGAVVHTGLKYTRGLRAA